LVKQGLSYFAYSEIITAS